MEDPVESPKAPEAGQLQEPETVKVFDIESLASPSELARLTNEEVSALTPENISAIKAKFGPNGIRAIMPQSRKAFLRTADVDGASPGVMLGAQTSGDPLWSHEQAEKEA